MTETTYRKYFSKNIPNPKKLKGLIEADFGTWTAWNVKVIRISDNLIEYKGEVELPAHVRKDIILFTMGYIQALS